MANKFLYGAAVQGIQGFIFQTNKLKEIVGASELVEDICTIQFVEELRGIEYSDYEKTNGIAYSKAKEHLQGDDNAVINAAGNIKYIFDNEEACKKMVKKFPRRIANFAPGITISQAVVELEDGKELANVVDELEEKLRAQRNKPMRDLELGLIGIRRSRQTNMPVCHIKDDNFWDAATLAKLNYKKEVHLSNIIYKKRETTKNLCQKAFGKKYVKHQEIPYDTDDLTDKNNWIAVIHADGNGLGQVVKKIGTDREKFKAFSKELDIATTEAAQEAFNAVEDKFGQLKAFPIRPIVLGGDDLTVICRGDLALDYVTAFLKAFEEKTKEHLGSILKEFKLFPDTGCLTACAGIAYVKASFPFYYGYELAESLCGHAKKVAKKEKDVDAGKKPADSCLMFYKVNDSFVEDFSDMERRTLKPQEHISFAFGPYFLVKNNWTDSGYWTIDELKGIVKHLKGEDGNKVKSSIRQWMTLLYEGEAQAEQRLDRIKEIQQNKSLVGELTKTREKDGVKVYPAYDVLAINTILNQETK